MNIPVILITLLLQLFYIEVMHPSRGWHDKLAHPRSTDPEIPFDEL